MTAPKRGDVWLVNLDPTQGREQAGRRPALVVSTDLFNASPAELVIVLPITSKDKGIRSHVRIESPEGGLKAVSFAKCEDVRSVSVSRLKKRWGQVSRDTFESVEDRLRILLEL